MHLLHTETIVGSNPSASTKVNDMEKKIPKWVQDKNNIKHDERIEFVGQMGVDGVIDGKLPNGEPYEWTKKSRRRLKRPKSSVH